jgi:hypothetical protein
MAWTEHLKAATLAPAGLRSSVPFQMFCPGLFIFLLLLRRGVLIKEHNVRSHNIFCRGSVFFAMFLVILTMAFSRIQWQNFLYFFIDYSPERG